MRRTYVTPQLHRLNRYLFYLKTLPEDDTAMISAPMIAAALHLGEVQVRKDLADTARPGSNKKGRVRKELIADLENYLGVNHRIPAVYIGDPTFNPWQFSVWKDRIEILQKIDPDTQSLDIIASDAQLAIINITQPQFQLVCSSIEQAGIHVILAPNLSLDPRVFRFLMRFCILPCFCYHETSEHNSNVPICKRYADRYSISAS